MSGAAEAARVLAEIIDGRLLGRPSCGLVSEVTGNARAAAFTWDTPEGGAFRVVLTGARVNLAAEAAEAAEAAAREPS